MELTNSDKFTPKVKQAIYWGKKFKKLQKITPQSVTSEQIDSYISYRKTIKELPFEDKKLDKIKQYIQKNISE